MYNSINPINITYRNPRQGYGSQASEAQNQEQPAVSYEQGSRGGERQFPNGAKVAIDYTKNTINISQIVTDFKSTVLAINAPDDISQEVNSYLSLVEKESHKQNPSREIIVSNLKNASKISDEYIAKSLNKPSRVVEGWIDALFMQKIELKADPTHINPDFQLDIPDKKAKSRNTNPPQEDVKTEDSFSRAEIQPFAREIETESASAAAFDTPAAPVLQEQSEFQSLQPYAGSYGNEVQKIQTPSLTSDTPALEIQHDVLEMQPYAVLSEDEFTAQTLIQTPDEPIEFKTIELTEPLDEVLNEPVEVLHNDAQTQMQTQAVALDTQLSNAPLLNTQKPRYVVSEHDREISKSLKEAKILLTLEDDPASALEVLNNTLGEITPDTNKNLRAALHFERGRIFDDYDYVNYALRDFYEATKCDDNNLKSQAHLKMARIYDDYVEFEPAMEHYQDALGYGGEADNLRAQTKILSEMASVYAGRYDFENTRMLSNLSVEAAGETGDALLISRAYSNAGRNYEYIGEDFAALESYKNAVKAIENAPEDADLFEMRAQNYEDAAYVMDRLGNVVKSENLLSKARLYRQRILLEQMSEAV